MSQQEKNYKGEKLLDIEWEKISKYVVVLDLFYKATDLLGSHLCLSCSYVLSLLSSLTKHMNVNDGDRGYIARFKVALIDDFKESVTGMKTIEIFQIATTLDPRYKHLKYL